MRLRPPYQQGRKVQPRPQRQLPASILKLKVLRSSGKRPVRDGILPPHKPLAQLSFSRTCYVQHHRLKIPANLQTVLSRPLRVAEQVPRIARANHLPGPETLLGAFLLMHPVSSHHVVQPMMLMVASRVAIRTVKAREQVLELDMLLIKRVVKPRKEEFKVEGLVECYLPTKGRKCL